MLTNSSGSNKLTNKQRQINHLKTKEKITRHKCIKATKTA